MKKEEFELLGLYMEILINRTMLSKLTGKDDPVVKELDKQLDAIQAKITGEC